MSTDNIETNDVTTDDNLDDFASDFFGGNSDKPSDNAKSEDDEVETDVEDDATEELEDTHSADDGATDDDEDDDSSDEEPDETDEDDDEPEQGKKPKKVNRFQERINELTAKARQEEREKLELLKRLEALEAKQNKEPEKTEKPDTNEDRANTGPQPTDKNEDGSDKYPLGEFDPKFLRDTVKHMLAEKEAEQREKEALSEKERQVLAQRAAMQESWNEKLVDVQERYPDYQEKGQELLDSLGDIEPAFAQYLTDTLMELDNGPEVFYYLASNPEEAEKIVNAGPRKATIALGGLGAKLGGTKTTQAIPKTTKAKTPPPRVKGSAVTRPSVKLDTDDLDAFSRELFKKK